MAFKDSVWTRPMPAYSLIEVSIVLLIIGVLAGATLKGYALLGGAKVRSVSNQMHQIRLNVHNYHDTYGFLPGDDPTASRYADVEAGQGTSQLGENQQNLVWLHLFKAKLADSPNAPSSLLGGRYSILSNPLNLFGLFLILSSENQKSLLTPQQAHQLKTLIDGKESTLDGGIMAILPGNNEEVNRCIKDGKLNLNYTKPACIALINLN